MTNLCAYCANDGDLIKQYVVSKTTVNRLYMCRFHREAQNRLGINPVNVIAYIPDDKLIEQERLIAQMSNAQPEKPVSKIKIRQYIQNIGTVRLEPINGMTDQELNNKMCSMFEDQLMIEMFEEEALKSQ